MTRLVVLLAAILALLVGAPGPAGAAPLGDDRPSVVLDGSETTVANPAQALRLDVGRPAEPPGGSEHAGLVLLVLVATLPAAALYRRAHPLRRD